MKKIFILLSIFSVSLSSYAQFDVVISSNGTPGAKVQIKNDDNNSNAFTGITNGSGAGLSGLNTATAGIAVGIRGSGSSTSNGTVIAGVTGVYGHITSISAGNNSAGVRGINSGTGYTSAGVIGYQAGSGRGVYGVRGETMAKDGAGVEAMYAGSGTGTALEIGNGAIKVTGNNRAAFIHTSTVANREANYTTIDNPMCNGDPDCMIFVTQLKNFSNGVYNNSPIGVSYNSAASKWIIVNENNSIMPVNAMFNVLVIKQ